MTDAPVPATVPAETYAALAAALEALPSQRHRRTAAQMVEALTELFRIQPDLVDLKITGAALLEMGEAFEMFAPYHDAPKVAIFGSARTKDNDPLYQAARDVAYDLAQAGWMVVTGAGPGIMQAAMEGAGREHSIGVSIRLPFEQGANPVIAGDEKYVSMKYFFTRKLMLVKESRGFICLPGGFGTLDETFELLTLTQTGKGLPVPIVFLDTPGDQYWDSVHDVIEGLLVKRGLVAEADTKLYLVTDDCHRRRRRDPALLRELPLAALRRRPARPAPPAHGHRRAVGAAQRTVRAPVQAREHRPHRGARPRTQGARPCRAPPHRVHVREARLRRTPRADRHAEQLHA